MAKAMGVAVGDGRRPAPRVPSSVPPNRPSPSQNPRRTAPPADTHGARQNVTAAADLFRIFIFPSKRDVRIDYRRCFVLRSLLCAQKKKKSRSSRVPRYPLGCTIYFVQTYTAARSRRHTIYDSTI